MPNSPPFSLSKILAKKDGESKYGRQHHSMFPPALTKAAVRQLPITPYDIFLIISSSFSRIITYCFVIESFTYYTIKIFFGLFFVVHFLNRPAALFPVACHNLAIMIIFKEKQARSC